MLSSAYDARLNQGLDGGEFGERPIAIQLAVRFCVLP
jgi:hypothetical protein